MLKDMRDDISYGLRILILCIIITRTALFLAHFYGPFLYIYATFKYTKLGQGNCKSAISRLKIKEDMYERITSCVYIHYITLIAVSIDKSSKIYS